MVGRPLGRSATTAATASDGGAATGALGDDGRDYERQRDGDGAPAPMRDSQRWRDRRSGRRGLASASDRLSFLPQRANNGGSE